MSDQQAARGHRGLSGPVEPVPTHAETLQALPEPVLEACRLQALADELGDSTPAIRFLSTYLSMLPGRILRISNGLCMHDPEASMDAVLSLKISSSMVGALETETQCRALESMIREDHFDSAVQALPALRNSTDRCFAAGPQLLGKAQESLCKGQR
ncbi:HPt (histidine-containing phosphotransfer) domain-containing protein [Paenarthrobacter sp. TE4293]|uniref:Hpt domain-containing protein n=1 Tax=Paenarthrobacter sp. TE4293 TaxID=3381695 RepID=UPI003D245F46